MTALPRAHLVCMLALALSVGACSPRNGTTPTNPEATGETAAEPAQNPVPAPPEAAPRAAADSTKVEEAQPIRVQISEEERARLADQAGRDLEVARAAAAKHPDLASLADEDRQRWETLAHYIETAQEFLDAGDVRAAADLAVKARLLAADLSPK